MIEVDVFWSFSFGAVFAASAAGSLKNTDTPWYTPSFVYTLLFLSLIFAPSGLYLLWDNPGWESMFVLGDKNEIHAILPTVFAFTNVLLGIIGYYITYRAIRKHRHEPQLNMSVFMPMIHAYTIFCAILGLGYNRFMYPSDYVAWRAGIVYPLTTFFTSRILFTLLAMGVVLLPAAYIPCYVWLKNETLVTPGDKSRLLNASLYYIIQGMVAVTGVFSTYTVLNYERNPKLSFADNVWQLFDHGNILDRNSVWSPLLGFWVAEIAVMFLVFVPIYLVPTVRASASRQKSLKTQ